MINVVYYWDGRCSKAITRKNGKIPKIKCLFNYSFFLFFCLTVDKYVVQKMATKLNQNSVRAALGKDRVTNCGITAMMDEMLSQSPRFFHTEFSHTNRSG